MYLNEKKGDGIDGFFHPHNIMCALTTSISTEFRC